MKKIVASVTLFALATILFSSCSNSSKLAFNKRHYRSGIFTDHIGRTNAVPVIACKSSKSNKQVSLPVTSQSENRLPISASMINSQKEKLNAGKINPVLPYKNIEVASATAGNKVTESPVIENREALSEGNQGSEMSGGASALSLLWVVIIIILIIWLIAIVIGGFGLGGGLINLLLLIALILLILWLLRIW